MNDNKDIKLYIVRHGETTWNVEKRFQGQLNSPLTKAGIEKIKDTAKKLENIMFQGIYTSQMNRTIETAKIILKSNKKSIENPLKIENMSQFNEIHFGIWQGMTYDEIKTKYPEEYDNYFNNPSKYEAWNTGGEDLGEGLDRFLEGIKKIISFEKDRKGSKNILLITHGTVFELFINYINNKKIEDLDDRELIDNGDYKIFSCTSDNKFLEIKI